MPDYRVISSDNHIYEPRDLWTSRIASKYRDQAPQIRAVEGGEAWFIADVRGQGLTQGTQPGKRLEDPDALLTVDTFENVLPGGYIPEEAVKDMDIDGVDVGIVYPTVGLPLFYCVRDSDLFSAVCGAYNDFVAEFCGGAPPQEAQGHRHAQRGRRRSSRRGAATVREAGVRGGHDPHLHRAEEV